MIVDKSGYSYLWPREPLRTHRILEINDRRAVLTGVCEASPPFQTLPILYTRYGLLSQFAPPERHMLSFVLVQHAGGRFAAGSLRSHSKRRPASSRLTGDQFIWKTIHYYFRSTGIPLNFGIVVALGFVVGIAVAGQTFYLFTIENLKQFGLLKAVGVRNRTLVWMILAQALIVSVIGFSLGIGMAAVLLKVLSTSIQHFRLLLAVANCGLYCVGNVFHHDLFESAQYPPCVGLGAGHCISWRDAAAMASDRIQITLFHAKV